MSNRSRWHVVRIVLSGALLPTAGSIVLLSGATVAHAENGARLVPVEISEVSTKWVCVAIVPGGVPLCEPIAQLTVRYRGSGCTSQDFKVRVRTPRGLQRVSVYQKAKSTCVIDAAGSCGELQSVTLSTDEIAPGLPVRGQNPLPVCTLPPS